MTTINSDCLIALKNIADNSVDSLVTDPPAGIAFLNNAWDDDKGGRKEWQKWLSEIMAECLRVLKPGAHGLVWALPKTSHWTATALEDAGFEVRDCVYHAFGSGFPKSNNIGISIDKLKGNKRDVVGKNPASRPYNYTKGKTSTGWPSPIRPNITKGNLEWEGWGTGLKPAVECWWLVRKPIEENTIAKNVLKYGTGGINIDRSRIPFVNNEDKKEQEKTINAFKNCKNKIQITELRQNWSDRSKVNEQHSQGRFPSHLLHDGSDEVLNIFPNSKTISKASNGGPTYGGNAMFSSKTQHIEGKERGYLDSGSASRFFYCSKVNKKERNAGCEELEEKLANIQQPHNSKTLEERYKMTNKNSHPTVKPQKLMSYLINLITPPNGIILDPFMGSGSTGVAAYTNGYEFIGIEKEKEYFIVANKRIKHAIKQKENLFNN